MLATENIWIYFFIVTSRIYFVSLQSYNIFDFSSLSAVISLLGPEKTSISSRIQTTPNFEIHFFDSQVDRIP